MDTTATFEDHLRAVSANTDDAHRAITALERRVTALEGRLAATEIDYGAPYNTNEQCQQHQCSYYRGYLAYGPPDLTHEGFHAGEKAAEDHIGNCKGYLEATLMTPAGACPICQGWEQRLRA